MKTAALLREVLPARMRPGWRMAIALPILIALAAGAVELGHAARSVGRGVRVDVAQLELEAVVADNAYPAGASCPHGGALVAAIALGAGLVVLGVLVGAVLAGGRCRCGVLVGEDDGDDGDGGDEDELDLPFGDVERLVVIALPRQDAPGAPAPPHKGPN